MATLESRLLQRVESLRDELLARTQEVVRCESITGYEDRVAPVYEAMLEDIGLEVNRWKPTADDVRDVFPHWDREQRLGERPNVFGTWRGSGGGPSLIINGHIDVVPPGDLSEWKHDPFGGHFDGEKVYGRGSVDMKGPLVAAIMAVKALSQEGFEPAGDVTIQCVMGEELGGLGTIAALARGYKADAAIVVEPTELQVCPAQGGHLKWKIEVQGQGAHTSVPWHGVSALEKWMVVYNALCELEMERHRTLSHPLFDALPSKVPFACGKVEAGSWPYIVADRLAAYGRIGALPDESLDELKQTVADAVRRAAEADEWLRDHPPVVTWVDGEFPGWETPADHPVVQSLGEAFARATGDAPTYGAVTYGSDASFLQAAGIPTVIFGAGGIHRAHRPNEFNVLDDLVTQAKVLALAIARWGQKAR